MGSPSELPLPLGALCPSPTSREATGGCVKIALPVPVDRLFDYAAYGTLLDGAAPGCRAVVPFGKRKLTGVIVERDWAVDSAALVNLRPLERILDDEPVLNAALLHVLKQAAEAALCPLGIALACALPGDTAARPTRYYQLSPRGRAALENEITPAPLQKLLTWLAATPRSEATLKRHAERAAFSLPALLQDGLLCSTAEGTTTRARRASRATNAATSAALSTESAPAIGTTKLETPFDLNPEQTAALAPITEAIRARRAESFLLHGVTGSGKTEIYLRAVAETLAQKRQALVLVPEITLTHQIVARLLARFGDRLAVLHSGLRRSERLAQWRRLRRGETPIAVGARSALFAPLENPGLIVIDEEHDGAYKNEEGFRYHARSLAELRSRAAGCPLVLGSATPSLETRHAADCGALRRLTLPRRIAGRPLPAVEIVDLQQERATAPRWRKLILSRPLRKAVAATLEGGGQSILFLNRRGFSTQVFCFDCGHAERCRHCDISLVYHARAQKLRCHYCDFTAAPPERCSHCGADGAALLGIGTERVEEEVRSLFPAARIARMDRDTTSRRGAAEAILRALRQNELDIVVGTQIVAKGHDLPGVQLVGVIAADLGLHVPDFRAAERTFQLLTQVAGRAGRAALPGRVIIQTFVPDHYAIRHVRTHAYEAFYAEELAHRAEFHYPPLGQLALISLSAPREAEVTRAAEEISALARAAAHTTPGCEVLGPAPAPIPRLRDRYRFQILLKTTDSKALHAVACTAAQHCAALPRPLRAHVDVAPTNLL